MNGRVLNMSHFTVKPQSTLVGKSVGALEQDYDLSVILLRRGKDADLHPAHDAVLRANDQVTVFADTTTLHRLNRLNK